MSYVEEITEALIKTLAYTGGLPVRQLAGHAANLGFWVGEVEHAFAVIDGYDERFKRLREGERTATELMGPDVHPFRQDQWLRPGISDHDRKELRQRLTEAVSLMMRRSYSEGLIAETDINDFINRLGLDPHEVKKSKPKGIRRRSGW